MKNLIVHDKTEALTKLRGMYRARRLSDVKIFDITDCGVIQVTNEPPVATDRKYKLCFLACIRMNMRLENVKFVKGYTKDGQIFVSLRELRTQWGEIKKTISPEKLSKTFNLCKVKVYDKYVKIKDGEIIVCNRDKIQEYRLDAIVDNNGIAHNPYCKHTDGISKHIFIGDFDINSKVCCKCANILYTRILVKSQFKDYDQVKAFHNWMNKYHIWENYKKFLYNNGVKLLRVEGNSIDFFVNEDTWRITAEENGVYTLWHNNYWQLDSGDRTFQDDFHYQNQSSNVNALFNLAISYRKHTHETDFRNKIIIPEGIKFV